MSIPRQPKQKKSPFDIPSINNPKLALMSYLDINDENVSPYQEVHQEVQELEGFTIGAHKVSVFEFKDERYHVSGQGADMEADVVKEFNSSLWMIKKIDAPKVTKSLRP